VTFRTKHSGGIERANLLRFCMDGYALVKTNFNLHGDSPPTPNVLMTALLHQPFPLMLSREHLSEWSTRVFRVESPLALTINDSGPIVWGQFRKMGFTSTSRFPWEDYEYAWIIIPAAIDTLI